MLKLPPMTPALSAGTPIGLRPENDSSSMSLASTVFRTATSVCSGVASAVTVTSSVIAPVSSVKSSVSAAAASSCTPVRLAFLKPCSSARDVVAAGGQVRERVEAAAVGDGGAGLLCLAVLVSVTVTPGTTPPCASLTVPEIVPRSNCA